MNPTTPPDKSPIMPHVGGAGEDINERYNKLTQEYQRIKTQNAILKKAVIQEQQKVAGLEKELRDAEVKLRQHTEETDILQFNNQRLTKRISVMQEELAAKSKEGGWLFGSRDNKKMEELDVLRRELEEKIQESAQLHVDKRDLEEDIKQSAQLHTDQINVLKACVVAKQGEVDQAAEEVQKINQSLAQLQEEMDRQNNYFKESEEKLGREVHQLIMEINQSRKKHKMTILNPNAAPPSPLSIWRDNKHTRELIGTFKDLYYAVEAHWDTHMDKITLLRGLNPPEQLSLIYKEIAATIPSLSTQMTHIAESLHQYLPVLFSKDALPNIEFADTLHRFVNTCKKWLSYQQLRHVELSQQGTGPHPQAHTALADVYVQVLRALDRLVADREVSAIRSLCSVLAALTDSTRAVYAQEAAGVGEGALGKTGGEGSEKAIVAVNEKLIDTQAKTVALLDKFAAKLDEYESLAGSGRLLQDGEDSHRLREIASHLIMLNNDISVASKERELHHMSVQRESDSFKNKLKELEDMLSKKDDDIKDLETRMNVTKEKVGVVTQELDKVKNEKLEEQKSFEEKQKQLAEAHDQAIQAQKAQLQADHEQLLEASLARSQAELDQLRAQLSVAQQTVEQLRQELQTTIDQAKQDIEQTVEHSYQELQSTKEKLQQELQQTREKLQQELQLTKEKSQQELQLTKEKSQQDLSVLQKRAEDAEQQLQDERQRSSAQSQDLSAHEGRAQESQRKHATEIQQLKNDFETKQKQLQELQSKLVAVEGTARTDMAGKAQQIQVLQQKLMAQEQRLDERTKQVQSMERVVAEREQLIVKLQQNPGLGNGNSPALGGSQGSLLDADILVPQSPPLAPISTPSLVDDTIPLTPTSLTPTTPNTPTANNGDKYSMTVVDQAGNQSNELNESSADKEKEQALREYYEGKMQHLASQAKASDSKAIQLFEQYSSLLKALEEKEAERNTLLDQIKISNQETKSSKEDLESTRTNYDVQLRLLSDHILELGEKIVQLEAQASAIQGCKVACGKCKTWNTIEWLMGEGRGGQRCVKGNHPLATFML